MEFYHRIAAPVGLNGEKRVNSSHRPKKVEYVNRLPEVPIDEFVAMVFVYALDSAFKRKKAIIGAGAALLVSVGLLNALPTHQVSGSDSSKETSGGPTTPGRQLLKTPGLNGLEVSFEDEMRRMGFSIHWVPVFGAPNRMRVVSAGEDGSLERRVPFADRKRFPELGTINWGGCFSWFGPEAVVMDQRDGTVDTYAETAQGFVRIHTVANGNTEWDVLMNDRRCVVQPDGSIVYDSDKGIIGPSESDRDHSKLVGLK